MTNCRAQGACPWFQNPGGVCAAASDDWRPNIFGRRTGLLKNPAKRPCHLHSRPDDRLFSSTQRLIAALEPKIQRGTPGSFRHFEQPIQPFHALTSAAVIAESPCDPSIRRCVHLVLKSSVAIGLTAVDVLFAFQTTLIAIVRNPETRDEPSSLFDSAHRFFSYGMLVATTSRFFSEPNRLAVA